MSGGDRSVLHRAHVARVDHRDPTRHRRVSPWVERLAWTLDESIPLPGGRRTGIDGVIGLVPVFGDLAGFVAGMVVVGAGALADVSVPTLIRMLWNSMLAAVVGLVPFAGDAFDIMYKANTRNIALIHADLADHEGTRRRSLWMIFVVTASFLVTECVMFALLHVGGYLVLRALVNAF